MTRFRRRNPAARGDPEAPLRILFVHTATDPTLGADTWVQAQIIGALDRTQHEIHVACVTGGEDDPTPTYRTVGHLDGVRIVPVDAGPRRPDDRSVRSLLGTVVATAAWMWSLVGLVRLVVRRRIDVIHTSDRPRDALVTVLLGKATRTPSIVHAHVSYGQWMSRILRWSLAHADHLIAVSSFVAEGLVSSGRSSGTVHVVLNAIDPEAWHPGRGRERIREELSIPRDAPTVVTVCRLFEEKGTLPLVEAVAAVRDHVPDVRLVVVGAELHRNGGYLAQLIEAVDRHGLGGVVTFTGRRSDVEAIMAAADVYAMPSFEEPFGLVFLEAMAMLLPVVALDNGGTREVVDHGVTGLLSEPGDHATLVENLVRLLRDRAERDRMGRNGRSRVVTHFTIERMASDVMAVYRLVSCPAATSERS